MATNFRTKQLAKNLVAKGGPVNKRMREVGFSEAYAKNPKKILTSAGFKKEIAKYRSEDLTVDLIRESLVHDIKKKPKQRIRELALGAQILGMTDGPDPSAKLIQINFNGLSDEQLARLVQAVERGTSPAAEIGTATAPVQKRHRQVRSRVSSPSS